MTVDPPEKFSERQMEFILGSLAKFNLASGPVRSGKTVCVLFRFMQAVAECPGDSIWMIGYNLDNVFHNCISLLLNDSPTNPLAMFSKLVTWQSSGILHFAGKRIYCIGASDERAVGKIQGKTFDLCYCNEMTLYPESVIEMITTRLSMPHSLLFADMNPVNPDHICKKWIDLAKGGDEKFYSCEFSIDDNPFLSEMFKQTLKQTLTGLFYRRNYLGEWCLADGAIFDFFDKKIHLDKRRKAVDYWVCGVDWGASNAFAAVIVGVKKKRYQNDTAYFQVQEEFYWDHKRRSKTVSELARDLITLFELYPCTAVYLDPSAAVFKSELRANGIHVSETDNDVNEGINLMTSMMSQLQLTVFEGCANLIREIEGYSWDPKASARGYDEPIKKNDHACVVGNTRIEMGNFSLPISSLPRRHKITNELINYNTISHVIEKDTIVNAALTRKKSETYELELEDGKILEATGDHRILTHRGFIRLDELTLSDTIGVCNTKFTSEESSTKT